jgi:ubiquinone/menaquinone biosynthesis C-methylase UbiE
MSAIDKVFAGSIPAIYESYMVPMVFQAYAADLAARVAAQAPRDVLEIAAGTGAVTRELVRRLPRDSIVTATDLNQAMLDVASVNSSAGDVRFHACDAMHLPFPSRSHDAVVCQFGVMFFPDKAKAYGEARRVLRPGGLYAFNVWDSLDLNPFTAVVEEAVANAFPSDPPGFFRRTPFGYHDEAEISAALAEAGFGDVQAETVTFPSRAPSAAHVAVALCQGTPMRSEIEQRAPGRLEEITQQVAGMLEAAFGKGPVESPMQAIVFEART